MQTRAQESDSTTATITAATDTAASSGTTIDGATTIVLSPSRPANPAFLYAVNAKADVQVTATSIDQDIELTIRVVQGKPGTVTLGFNGTGEVVSVAGERIESWSVRSKGDEKYLDLQLNTAGEQPAAEELRVQAVVQVRSKYDGPPTELRLAHLAPGKAIGFDSRIQIRYSPELSGRVVQADGFVPLAEEGRSPQFQTSTGGQLVLRLDRSSTAPAPIELVDASLNGELAANRKSIVFHLIGKARVAQAGARLRVLSGNAAFSELPAGTDYRLELVNPNAAPVYDLVFPNTGEFPVDLTFVAGVTTPDANWRSVDLTVAASAVVPLTLDGFAAELEFKREPDSIVPLVAEGSWSGFLPATGRVHLQWKDAQSASEGKLFFTTTARVEAQVGPGLLRQDHQLTFQVLQGQLKSLSIQLLGPGEIIDVQGSNLVGWDVKREGDNQTLEITLSQPLSGESQLRVLSQTPLDSFPVRMEGMRLLPLGTIRHSGFLRVTNLGSVRVEATNLQGLTQLSPDQFPGEAIDARQAFVYRFPSGDYAFTVLADRVQSEVNANTLLLYQLSESDRVIEADVELDIREAAIREWDITIPADYSVVSVVGASLADYVVASEPVERNRNVKLIFQSDVQGRQLVSLRLEKNEAAAGGAWVLPRIDFPQAKSVRGDIGVVGAAGYRIVTGTTEQLVEKPLSYFPKPQANLQQAFRMREATWSATMLIEPLERSIRSDVFHLYSLSQGTIYGSALVNYLVTGAPTAEFILTVPQFLGNVTVDGQDIRTWRRDGDKLLITLHQPVLGSYTLLVTFEEKPNETDGSFAAGIVTPLNVQGDRGYIEIVSPVQVEMTPLLVSPELLVLDPLELPAEFRLLSTAPTLGTWQYTERPFDLKLKVTWFEPGTTAGQVVEFSEANSRVSPDGELVTDVLYYVKTRGQRTLRLQLPAEPVKLWAVTVSGQPVTARQTGNETLIPLPGGADPNVPIEVGLRLGKPSIDKRGADLLLPIVDAPVLKTQWNIRGDENFVLLPNGGTVEPTQPVLWPTGFDWLANRGRVPLILTALAVLLGLVLVNRRGARILSAFCFVAAFVIAVAGAWDAWEHWHRPQPIQLNLPVLAAGEKIALNVENVPVWQVQISWPGVGLIVVGIAAMVLARLTPAKSRVRVLAVIGLGSLITGTLLHPNGGIGFFGVMAVVTLLWLLVPTVIQMGREWMKRNDQQADQPAINPTGSEGSVAVTSLLWLVLTGASMTLGSHSLAVADEPTVAIGEFHAADSLQQSWQVSVREARLKATATIQVTGVPGDRFVLLQAPATLTRFAGDTLRLTKVIVPELGQAYVITIPFDEQAVAADDAEGDGDKQSAKQQAAKSYTATFEYRLEAIRPGEGVQVLTGRSALHQIDLQLDEADWEITCSTAVRIEPLEAEAKQTKANLLLSPGPASIVLQPQSRDLSSEETQFFVEGSQLYIPGPGVVDGRHRLDIRTSQGRLKELTVVIPETLTVSTVEGPVTSWQFDADQRRLQLQLDVNAGSRFNIIVETQRSLDTLPTDLSLLPLRVEGANGEVGLIGVAFASDAQPEKVDSESLSVVSLSDFDASLSKNPQAVLHRVYRYGKEEGGIEARVTPVTPELRVNSRQVLSFGDERILLNVNFTVSITRTGLFQLSFPLPPGLEVESLSGDALHHWTESNQDGSRQVVLHLNGKTMGDHAFSLALAGAAPSDGGDWPLPRFALNEAERQTGDIVVRPMTGLRLRAVNRKNVSEIDPRSLGGQGEGALAFRLLQRDWELSLGIEKLDAWVIGDVLHEVTLREGQTRSSIIVELEVQNASIRTLSVDLPITDAEEIKTIRTTGKSVADFVRTAADSNRWELQFKQRVIGRVQFQIEYERRGERTNERETLSLVEFPDTRQLSYYYAVRTGGRLEVEPSTLTQGWQRVDWSVVPATLREAANRSAPALSLRAITPSTPLELRVIRHSLADALKLRVTEGKLTTLLSPTGDQLTAVDVTVEVVQRSSLNVSLPEGGKLFNIFVNGESVHSIRQSDASNSWQFYILPGIDDRTAQVRFVYMLTGEAIGRLTLVSPKLNVPLENVKWDVIAPRGYELVDNGGDLELINEDSRGIYDRSFYLSKSSDKRKSQAAQAQQMLAQASELLQAGEQTKAQRALSNVFNSNALDAASNEDARVQLENLQTQQAVVGLNTRRQRLYLDNDLSQTEPSGNEQMRQAAAANPVLQQDQLNYRPQELSQLLAGNTSEDNAVLQQIAGRLVQHQRTSEPAPQAIVISLPEEGTVYSFRRSVQVEESAPLELDLRFRSEYKLRVWEWALVGSLLTLIVIGIGRKSPELWINRYFSRTTAS